jgi:hypothetical protein
MQQPDELVQPSIQRNAAPQNTIRFEVHEIRRVPTEISDKARELIDASSYEGRLLPQALSEFFGSLPDVTGVVIDALPKADFFEVDEDDRDTMLLSIVIQHAHPRIDDHRILINAAHLQEVADQKGQGFEAAATAEEMHRQYRSHLRTNAHILSLPVERKE